MIIVIFVDWFIIDQKKSLQFVWTKQNASFMDLDNFSRQNNFIKVRLIGGFRQDCRKTLIVIFVDWFIFWKGVCIHVEKKSSLLTKTSKLIQKTNNLAILFSFYDNPGEIHIYTKRTSMNSFCCKKQSKSMKNAVVFI